MPYECSFCQNKGNPVPDNDAYLCSVCKRLKPMHKECCEKHSMLKHKGRPTCEKKPLHPLPKPLGLHSRSVR